MSVQVYGRKKNAIAVAHCKPGSGLIKVNGQPIHNIQNETLRTKVLEPIYILGLNQFEGVDVRVRVSGGGHVSQAYAIRQAIAKSIVAFIAKNVDETTKAEIKNKLLAYDRTLLVADNRRREAKKFGGPSARTRYQKSYR